MQWKDTLLAGGSRTPQFSPYAGSVPYNDHLNQAVMHRSDWVMGPGGVPVISGSSEQQGGPMVPSPGFLPVDAGQYGSNPFFAGRGSAVSQAQGAGGALSSYAGSSAELLALLKALQSLVPGGSGSGLLLPG